MDVVKMLNSFSTVFLIEESAPIEILISGINKNTGD